MHITIHAEQRARERFGLCRESIEKLAERAQERGDIILETFDSVTIRYGEKIFVFIAGNLVTVSLTKKPNETNRVYRHGEKKQKNNHEGTRRREIKNNCKLHRKRK